MAEQFITQGTVVLVDFGATGERLMHGIRPAIVVSNKEQCESAKYSGCYTVVPLTSHLDYGEYWFNVPTYSGGKRGYACCNRITTISAEQVKKIFTGIAPITLHLILDTIKECLS